MDVPHESAYERNESIAHRLDRNYAELLQELRVAQTGVQILFAFLLGIAFQQRFDDLGSGERALYVVTLVSAATAAVLLIAPVAAHRVLFGRRRKSELVAITGRLAVAGLSCLVVAILSAVLLVVGFVANLGLAVGIVAALGAVVGLTWLVVPFRARRQPDQPGDAATRQAEREQST